MLIELIVIAIIIFLAIVAMDKFKNLGGGLFSAISSPLGGLVDVAGGLPI